MDLLPKLEQTNLEAYESVAEDFDKTRYKIWPSTFGFLKSLNDDAKKNSIPIKVLEVGCGNGKNFLQEFDMIKFEGSDICQNLLKICESKGYNVTFSDGCSLPYTDNIFDHVFSVAVLHHMSTQERRIKFIEEMVRVCKPNGKISFQVWATTSPKFNTSILVDKNDIHNHDRYVTYGKNNAKRFYHFFTDVELKNLVGLINNLVCDEIFFEKDNWVFRGRVIK